MSFSPDAMVYGKDCEWHLSFPLAESDVDLDFSIEDERVIKWGDDDKIYGVQLLALRNEEDLINLCVNPLTKIYEGKTIGEAFGGNIPESIVRLPPKEQLMAQ